ASLVRSRSIGLVASSYIAFNGRLTYSAILLCYGKTQRRGENEQKGKITARRTTKTTTQTQEGHQEVKEARRKKRETMKKRQKTAKKMKATRSRVGGEESLFR